MNINTNTLLTMLAPKMTQGVKTSIENLSKDGKVEVSSLLKDKNIKTLIDGLLQDVSKGDKSKSTISSILQSNKNIFDLKSLSTDIKSIVDFTQKDPKLSKQTEVLKQFQVDIKAVDDKNLKTNISNSGVFLESKLANKPATPSIPYNVKVSVGTILEQTKNIDSTIKDIKNIQTNSTQEQKISSNENTNKNIQTNSTQEQKISSNENTNKNTIKSSEQLVDKLKTLTKQIESNPKLQDTTVKLKNLTSKIESNTPNTSNLATIKSTNIPKTDTNQQLTKLLNNIEDTTKQIQTQAKAILNTPTIEQSLETKPQNIKDLLNATLLKKDTQTNHTTTKEHSTIEQKTSQAKALLSNIQNDPKLSKEVISLKQFISSGSTTQTISSNQSTDNTISIKHDIKAALLQIDEQIDDNSSSSPQATKEVKAQVEKVLSQIEFFQLSSYVESSNHTYLPFDWEDLEDGDIEFKANKKDSYSCRISLSLKEQGDINVYLLLDDKNNLNINMNLENSDFKTQIQQNLKTLRHGINNIGLVLESLNVLDIKKEQDKSYAEKAYSNNNLNLNFGVDIQA